MKVHQLRVAPSSELAQALEAFEKQFTYPLGPGRAFTISHGLDYARFYRAMGQAVCFATERNGRITGTIGTALRELILPGGERQPALYLGDLKVSPAARGGRTILALSEAVREWVGDKVRIAYGVVMNGTPALPQQYTGRLGIPRFHVVGEIVVWRLSCAGRTGDAGVFTVVNCDVGEACFRDLIDRRYACLSGDAADRSEIKPKWLVHADGSACGRLEDTRQAKRLFADDGAEMISAHLSCFAFRDSLAGAHLLRAALQRAHELGYPALFVALVPNDADMLRRALIDVDCVAAGASVYGVGLEAGGVWNINTAEI